MLAEKKMRNSNIELLRIISMFLIITHHFAIHTDFKFIFGSFSFQKVFIDFLASFGKIGVNIFIIISCYYLVGSFPKMKKAFILFMQVSMYSIIIYLIIGFSTDFSLMDFIKSCFPFLFNLYWFATTYFIFYISIPILNIIYDNISKRQYEIFIGTATLLFVIIPTFFYRTIEYSNLIWFYYLYFIIGYIKKYKISLFYNDSKKCARYSFVCILFILLSIILFNILGTKFKIFFLHSAYFSTIYKLPAFLTSLFCFFWFLSFKPSFSKFINIVSQATFGVYLLHDNPFFSPILWNRIIMANLCTNLISLVFCYILSVTTIFILSIAIELVRAYLFNNLFVIVYNKFLKILKNVLNGQLYTFFLRDFR